jgi:hypothetical protein
VLELAAPRANGRFSLLPQHADALQSWQQLLQQRQILSGYLRARVGISGDVAAGSSKARDQAEKDRITRGPDDDGNGRACAPRGERRGRTAGDDDFDLRAHQFCRKGRQRFESPVGVATLDMQVLTLHPAELSQRLGFLRDLLGRAGRRTPFEACALATHGTAARRPTHRPANLRRETGKSCERFPARSSRAIRSPG